MHAETMVKGKSMIYLDKSSREQTIEDALELFNSYG